jgi:hypothetical protein
MNERQFSTQEDFPTGFAEGDLMALPRISMNAARRIGCICRRVSLRGVIFFLARFMASL